MCFSVCSIHSFCHILSSPQVIHNPFGFIDKMKKKRGEKNPENRNQSTHQTQDVAFSIYFSLKLFIQLFKQ